MEVKTPDNPSKTATARVKNPLPIPTACHICGGSVRLGTHQEVYGMDYSDWPYVYICDGCKSYVGLHPFTNIPLGIVAEKDTRKLRMKAKNLFEPLWQHGHMSRTEAYEWLAKEMGIAFGECHFGWFNDALCEIAIDTLNRMRGGHKW